jgi:P-loop containing NTP hydrolase pore-1
VVCLRSCEHLWCAEAIQAPTVIKTLMYAITCGQAKNFVPGAEGKSTKVSATVLALQEQLPKARIVYCSATGVSESHDLTFLSERCHSRSDSWGKPAVTAVMFKQAS